jgi:hypothetical protein
MTQLVANLAPLGSLVGEVASMKQVVERLLFSDERAGEDGEVALMKQVVERLLFSDERAGEEEFPRTLAKLY